MITRKYRGRRCRKSSPYLCWRIQKLSCIRNLLKKTKGFPAGRVVYEFLIFYQKDRFERVSPFFRRFLLFRPEVFCKALRISQGKRFSPLHFTLNRSVISRVSLCLFQNPCAVF